MVKKELKSKIGPDSVKSYYTDFYSSMHIEINIILKVKVVKEQKI